MQIGNGSSFRWIVLYSLLTVSVCLTLFHHKYFLKRGQSVHDKFFLFFTKMNNKTYHTIGTIQYPIKKNPQKKKQKQKQKHKTKKQNKKQKNKKPTKIKR